MTRRKTTSGNLKQPTLVGFLKPDPSKTSSPPSRNDRSRIKRGPTRRHTTTVPSQLSEHSHQSDTDSGVDTIHFEPRRVVISDDDDDDDDMQPSSPVKRRRTVTEVEAHTDRDTSSSSDSEESPSANRRAMSSTNTKRPVARSPSTEAESLPKRRRLARGVRPPSPEGSDDLLGEVDEAGNYFIELCKGNN
jgi:hypothetical protein